MNKNVFRKFSLFFVLIIIFFVISLPFVSSAEEAGFVPPSSIQNPIGVGNFTDLIEGIISWVVDIGLLVAVVMIIYSGYLFVISAGKDEGITRARKALTWSVIGLVVLLIGRGWIDIVNDLLGGGGSGAADALFAKFVVLIRYIFGIALGLAIIYTAWGVIDFAKHGGDATKISEAKKKLIYGLLGIIIITGVLTIMNMISVYFTGSQIPTIF